MVARKKKYKIKWKNLFTILVILSLIGYYGYNKILSGKEIQIKNSSITLSEKSDFLNNISYENNKIDFNNYKDTIVSFLNDYYYSIYYLKSKDFSKYFSDDLYLNVMKYALKYQISLRKDYKNDYKLSKASFDITFDSVEVDNGNTLVTLYTDSVVRFNLLNKDSYYYGSEHKFIFDNNNKLVSYYTDQDFYSPFYHKAQKTSSVNDLKKLYTKFINKYNNDKDIYSNWKNEYDNKSLTFKSCDNTYNRKDALKYAEKYVIKRNLDEYEMYDNLGGNCQNFGSQVVHYGGIPLDTTGEQIWKYYGYTPDNTNISSGRSSSWSIVDDFYNYVKLNTGYGLCGSVDVNMYYADKGDIIQIGTSTSYAHTIVVVDNIKNKDIIVNSNTSNYKNVPLKAISAPNKRLIKILGWNN